MVNPAFDTDLEQDIRRAGGDPRRLAELSDRLVAEHARIDEALRTASRWIDEGAFVEAVGYSEDAGNLVRRGRAVDDAIARISLDAVRLPGALDQRLLDALDVAYADVAAIEDLLAIHRRLALAGASTDERLEALDPIRRRHRRHRGWWVDSDELEAAALEALGREADAALAISDEAALERLHERLSRRHWGREIPDRLADILRSAREDLRRRRIAAEAEGLAARLHRAFAGMDAEAVAAIEPEWRRLAAPDGTAGAAIAPAVVESAESAFRWLASQREAERADRRASEAIAELERLLDADAPLEELRACRGRIADAGGVAPARLAGRLAAAEHRDELAARRRRRRRVAGIAGTVAIGVSIAAYVAWRVDRDRRSLDSIEEVARRVDRGEFERAEILLAELEAAATGEGFWSDANRTRWLELEGDAREAIAASKERSRRLDAALAEVERGLEADRTGDPERPDRRAELGRLQAILASVEGAGEDPRLAGPRSEIDARIDAISRREIAALRGRLLELEQALAAVPTVGPDGSPEAAEQERNALAALAVEATAIAADPGAGPAESDAARSILARLERRIAAAERRRDSLESFAALRDRLGRASEEIAFLESYEALLERHGDVLAARGELAAHEDGLLAARRAEAVAHWRRTAARSILAATPLDDPWHPADAASARTVGAILAEHLSRHPRSPYAAPATALVELAEAFSRPIRSVGDPDDPAGLVGAALRASGWGDLLRVPLANGGFVYRKAGGEGVFDNALASSGDLGVPAGRLLPRTDTTSPASAAPQRTMPARLLEAWLPRIENAPASRVRGELLGLVEAAAAADESDSMLQLAFLESLHRLLAMLPTPGVPGEDPARTWLDRLDRRTPPARPVDWAADGPLGREELATPRRLARLALASMPDPAAAREASAAAWSALRDELRACSVAGVLAPTNSGGGWRFVPVGAGGEPRRLEGLIVVEGNGAAATFMPVEIEQGAAVFLGPEPPPAARLVFVR